MPLKKSATKKQDSDERLRRYHARQAAIKKFGAAAVKGMTVHHKDQNNKNNDPGNLELKSRSAHGKEHGRGNGARGKNGIGKKPKKK
jgi:hypothetical protein